MVVRSGPLGAGIDARGRVHDIQEAPRVCKVYALRHRDYEPLYPKPDANQVEKDELAATRRAFLMKELRTNYSGINYFKFEEGLGGVPRRRRGSTRIRALKKLRS